MWMDDSTSPKERRYAGKIRKRVVDGDQDLITAIDEDLEPENSQEAYGYALKMVKTPQKSAEE